MNDLLMIGGIAYLAYHFLGQQQASDVPVTTVLQASAVPVTTVLQASAVPAGSLGQPYIPYYYGPPRDNPVPTTPPAQIAVLAPPIVGTVQIRPTNSNDY